VQRRLQIIALVSGTVLVVSIALYGRAHSGSLRRADLAAPIAISKRVPAPALHEPTLSGGSVDLTRMRGRPVVINFFASWCAPCKAEATAFADAADAYSGRVQFVGVAIDDSRSGALSYTHRYNWNWPIVFDPHDRLVGPFGLIGKPTTFVLDADGRVAWKLQRELTRDELSTALDDVLDK
jgi:cytochrome c biogenesis protein CcmG, thiol:disulfide interchange protein DsbE